MQASISYDFADRPASLTVTSPGGTEPVVTAASYLPAGPLTGLALGSGTGQRSETRAFDGRYAPTAIGVSGDPAGVGDRTWSYTTDPVGNVLEILEQGGLHPGARGPRKPDRHDEPDLHLLHHDRGWQRLRRRGSGRRRDLPGPGHHRPFEWLLRRLRRPLHRRLRRPAAAVPPELRLPGRPVLPDRRRRPLARGPRLDLRPDRQPPRRDPHPARRRPGHRHLPVPGQRRRPATRPVLDHVTLGIGGTRDYTWDAAGNLDQVAAGANLIDFAFDDESRLASVGRTVADVSSDFLYDGRSFLRSAVELQGDPPAEAASVRPLYSSDGLLQALRRKAAPTDPEELVVFVYFAGRPVAQLAIDGAGAETWTYLTTDHLGTPLLATDDAGAVVWEGGFEPFGGDYQQGTSHGALENEVYLRFGNEWTVPAWENASSGVPLLVGFDRWQTTGTARYLRPLPEIYYLSSSTVSTTQLDPPAGLPDSMLLVAGEPLRPIPSLPSPALIGASPFAKTVCDGCGGFKWVWISDRRAVCAEKCFVMHEEDHIDWFHQNRPNACKGRHDGANPLTQPGDKAATECHAYGVSFPCLEKERRKAKALGKTQECQSFLSNNARRHKKERDDFCKLANP